MIYEPIKIVVKIEIKDCSDCPFYEWIEYRGDRCKKLRKFIAEDKGRLDKCPLVNSKQYR